MPTSHQKVPLSTVLTIVALALFGFSGILSETSMNVTFPVLMKEFNLPLSTLQWVTTLYLLAVAIVMTTSATLKHNFKERTIFTAAFAFFLAGSLMAIIWNHSFYMMLIGRVLQGIGTGIVMPMMFILILERIPKQRIGLFMGLAGLVLSLAPAMGPTYGGMMIGAFEWEWIFIGMIPVPVIAFVLGMVVMKNSPKSQTKRSFNVLTFLLLTVSLSALLMAISSLETGNLNWWYVLIFVISMALFIWFSLHSQRLFLDIRILSIPTTLLGLFPFLIFQFTNLAINFLIPNFLQITQHSSSTAAGFALLPGTLMGAFLAPALGHLYDRKGARFSLNWGNALFAFALALFAIFTQSIGLISISIIYIIFTIGRNMAFNNVMAVSARMMSPEKVPDMTAIFHMGQQFAGAIGTAIAAVMMNRSPDMVLNVHHLFILLLVLSLLIFPMFYGLLKNYVRNP